ncbi:uridine phosphorylase [Sodalis endosymbiont of Henestaris halophilus]|uniref:uridine phosphorylase n=1 Tax=Sodalis endosymbiont of Henestaris halophilus TaxID=1929246 RepID=UPI000BC03548|nr:uridine phosphorylase [Sodalis endosymbiont of Henestaris halophilus]SNC59065.1 Uridine phosphorylase [Sodalis endosymbiont of Henestaris halophilus]
MARFDVFHLGLTLFDFAGASLAILPGDPQRVEKIAGLMTNPVHLATHREFTVWRAELAGKAVIVCSTGIGGPSTSIAVEELSQLGIRIFLRVGTTGAIQNTINVSDVLVTTAAVRLDGASQHFAPLAFPAVADFVCTTALVQAAKKSGARLHVGVTASSDTFYPGQERYDTYSGRILRQFKGSMQELQGMGVMNYEMESATLFTMCATQGLSAGMVTGVIVNRLQQEFPNDLFLLQQIESNTVVIVLDAAKTLLTKPDSEDQSKNFGRPCT